MKKHLISLGAAFLVLVTQGFALPDLSFSDDPREWDEQIRTNYQAFVDDVEHSDYYCPSRNVRPEIDYMIYLSNQSHQPHVPAVLHHLLTTGGPFGWADRDATPQEMVFMGAAYHIAVTKDPTLTVPFTVNEKHREHLQALSQIAGATPEWKTFLNVMTCESLFKVHPDGRPVGGSKYSFNNDLELLGFIMGVLPDTRGIDAFITQQRAKAATEPQQVLSYDHHWMERQHNYVQRWFPIHTVGQGDGPRAPRVAASTIALFKVLQPNDGKIIQQAMRQNFQAMMRFWGQKVVVDPDYGSLTLQRWEDPEGTAAEKHWIQSPHNYDRITRVLRCLTFFDLIAGKEAFIEYLGNISGIHPQTKDSYDRFWEPAARNPLFDDKTGEHERLLRLSIMQDD